MYSKTLSRILYILMFLIHLVFVYLMVEVVMVEVVMVEVMVEVVIVMVGDVHLMYVGYMDCLLYTSPSPRD